MVLHRKTINGSDLGFPLIYDSYWCQFSWICSRLEDRHLPQTTTEKQQQSTAHRGSLPHPQPIPVYANYLPPHHTVAIIMDIAPIECLKLGLEYTKRKISAKCMKDVKETDKRRFRASYGVSPEVCTQVWHLIYFSLPVIQKIDHLLWALLFMKVYASETVLAGIVEVDEKTFRRHVWTVISSISDLKGTVVSYKYNHC